MNLPYHNPTPQRATTNTPQYPYDNRSHTYCSPSGMNYPARTGSSNHTASSYNGIYHDHRHPMTPAMGDSYHRHPNRASTQPASETTYGPGDWLPQPRSASEVYGNPPQDHPYLNTNHGHSAPVTPYGLRTMASQQPPNPSSMIQPWALESGGVSSGSYLTPGYNSAPIHVQRQSIPSPRHLSPTPGRPHTAGMADQSYSRPRSEGRNRPRAGPPPKAVLGGVGGKTWDELRSADRSVSTPLPSTSDVPSESTPGGSSDHPPLPDEDTGPKFKGNPIVFRPPLPTYSPPDSPEPAQSAVIKECAKEDEQNPSIPKELRKSRKEAFPWPARKPRGPPETIPLPLSPSDTTMKGRRRNMRTGVSRDIVRDGGGTVPRDGEKVPLSIPDPEAWDRLKAKAQENGMLALVQAQDSSPATVKGDIQSSESTLEQDKESELPSTPCRSQSFQDHARRSSSSGTSVITSPPSSRRGMADRMGGNQFIRRQLGGMIQERTKSVEEVPSSNKKRLHSYGSSLSIDEGKVNMGHRILGHARGGSAHGFSEVRPQTTAESKTSTDVGPHAKTVKSGSGPNHGDGGGMAGSPQIDQAEKDDDSGPDKQMALQESSSEGQKIAGLTPLQLARQRVEDSLRAIRVVEPPSPVKLNQPRQAVFPVADTTKASDEVPPESTRKRKIKLANFDGYLGRQLGVSGLLGPKIGRQREGKTDTNTPKDEAQQVVNEEFKSVPQVLQENHDSRDIPENSKKRVRSTSTQNAAATALSGFGFVVSAAPASSLRPTPYTFRPQSPSTGTAFKLVPEGHTSFNFSIEGSASNVLRPAAAVFMPRHSISSAIETAVLKAHTAASEPHDTDSRLDSPIDPNPASSPDPVSLGPGAINKSGAISDSPIRAHTPNSPAAEMHGIYDTSPAGSILDEDLFYRPPRSNDSPIAPEPEELDSFDPVSYSYDPTEEDIFEPSDILTSTPRAEHSRIDSSPRSIRDTSLWHDAQEARSPTIKIAPPHLTAGEAKQKFKTWVFPKSSHGFRPSISRRHTFDIQYDHEVDEGSDASPTQPGVASTFASRVGDLRAFLAQNAQGDHLRVSSAHEHVGADRSSVEFPIRSPTKVLAVVNDDFVGDGEPAGDSAMGMPPVTEAGDTGLRELMERLEKTVSQLVIRLGEDQRGSIGNNGEETGVIMRTLNGITSSSVDLANQSSLMSALDQQSTLISAIASAVQTQKSHSSDYLVPLLEGQQTLMNRFEDLSTRNDSLANGLENISSAVSKQHQDHDRNGDQTRDVSDLRVSQLEIDDLRNQLHRLELEREREKVEAEITLGRVSEERERVQSLEADLRISNTKNQNAINDKRDLEESQRRLRDNHERIQAELEEARTQLTNERRAREVAASGSEAQAREMLEIRRITSGFGEILSSRLASMEEKLEATTRSVGSEALMERNDSLELDLRSLRIKLGETVEERRQAEQELIRHRSNIEKLQTQLDHETSTRKQWQERSTIIESYLAQEREYRTQAEVTARERTYVAELQEARIMSLMEDVHHWRSFAMAYDRNAYKEFLRTNPFRGFPATGRKTRNGGLDSPSGGADDDDGETVKGSRVSVPAEPKSHTQQPLSSASPLLLDETETKSRKTDVVGPL